MSLGMDTLLFDDHDPEAAETSRSSPVEPARPSPAARAKAGSKRTPEGLPVHSFQTLLADLATLTRNRVQPAAEGAVAADVHQPHALSGRSLPPPRRPSMSCTQ